MRLREPLLGGSAAMPGASLQRACRLLVAVCALHLGVTLVYYLSGGDLKRLPQLVGVPAPLLGGPNGSTTGGPSSGESRSRGARPPASSGVSLEPRGSPGSSSGVISRRDPASNLTSISVFPATALSLPACPEESPLLGKDRVPGQGLPCISPSGIPGRFPHDLVRDSHSGSSAPNSKKRLGAVGERG